MARPGTVIGWKLDRERARASCSSAFRRAMPNAVADHVTLEDPTPKATRCRRPVDAEIVGRADDGDSLEAMVVTIDGTTDRPDGSTFHITWSLDEPGPPRRAKAMTCSANAAGSSLDEPVPVTLEPARFCHDRTCSSTATACWPISTPARRALLGMSPARVRGAARQARILAAARPRQDFYADLPLMPDARAAVRRGRASRADHPHRPAARQLGGAAEGPLGRRAFPGHARSSPPWRATSIGT